MTEMESCNANSTHALAFIKSSNDVVIFKGEGGPFYISTCQYLGIRNLGKRM
jgi:hypothetical protein